jgi:hypothetical protein
MNDLLVTLDLQVQGNYYHGTLVGLTDAHGVARLTRSELEAQFAQDRRTFPMDYRVPLSDCDSTVIVKLRGGQEFETQRQAAMGNPLVLPEATAQWDRARNGRFVTATRTTSLDGGSSVNVTLAIEPKGAA